MRACPSRPQSRARAPKSRGSSRGARQRNRLERSPPTPRGLRAMRATATRRRRGSSVAFVLLPFSPAGKSVPRLLDALDHSGDALPAADAHGDERVASADALQLVHRLHREDATGGTDRMTERHGATVGVDLPGIHAELLGYAQCL